MLIPRQHCFFGLLCVSTALFLLQGAAALATSAHDPSTDAFALLAQAMRANHQTYFARQETLFASGASGTEWTCVVADVAHAGRSSCMTYRFPPSVADLIVADNGTLVRQFQPSCRLFLVRRSDRISGRNETELRLLHQNYRCRRQGEVSVEGHLCDRIAVQPRFIPGPWRVYWINRSHRLIVRAEEYDAAGRRRYVSALTAVHFALALPAALFSPPLPAGTKIQNASASSDGSYAQAWAAAGGNGRAPCWLPQGWERLGCAAVGRPDGGQAFQMRFSDGLKTFSVFEEALTPALPPLPLQQKMLGEQLGRYGQQAWVMENEGVRVTVVGDATLPPEIGREILRALLPTTDRILAHGLTRDFGASAAALGIALRRQGWGYEQIVTHLLARRCARPQEQARVWITLTLSSPKH